MSSLIEGYTYDIFISYRQKDNKYDGWVTEFADNFKKELEATFKEEVSVYFDNNPRDGLLETHEVDASLRDKLKCLVFIPVISKTYCDPNSYAWEHEFKTFVDEASHDRFGLRITLPNGNVASRVLPVRIHELEETDNKLCETLLGGYMRGIDFIYKSAGVNRPLRANEDHLQNNVNKIYYRDQINKVANATDGIIHCLKNNAEGHRAFSHHAVQASLADLAAINRTAGRIRILTGLFTKRILMPVFLALAIIGIILIYSLVNRADYKKSLAILPFRCQSGDSALQTKNDILNEIAMTKLLNLKSLTIRPRISTLRYRNTDKSLSTVRKELEANYIVEGSLRREGDRIIVWLGLNDAKHNKQLWADEFIWDDDRLSSIVSRITRNIASSCNASFSGEELSRIDSNPTSSASAYLDYVSANVLSNNAWDFFNTENVITEPSAFTKAIYEYNKAIRTDPFFAGAYARRAITESWGYYTGQFDTSYIGKCRYDIAKALEIDKDLPDAQTALGFYYLYCDTDYQKSLVHFSRASLLDPDNYQPLFYMALVYRRRGDWGKSQNLISRVIRQNPQVPLFLTNIGLSYVFLHNYDSALIYHQNAIDIQPSWSPPYENKIEAVLLKNGNIPKARTILEAATKNTGKRLSYIRIRLDIYDNQLQKALNDAFQSRPGEFTIEAERYLLFAKIYGLLNNGKTATIYYDSALVSLKSAIKFQNTPGYHSFAAYANAGKGNTAKAIEESRQAVDLAAWNSMEESDMKLAQAEVFTMTGDYDNAIKNIEYLLENPSCFSPAILRLDPAWKPLLSLARVRSLIDRHSD